MTQGVIKRLNEKGYGFIAVEGEAKDYFFHLSELKDVAFNDLREGDVVTFEETAMGKNGPQAKGVSRA